MKETTSGTQALDIYWSFFGMYSRPLWKCSKDGRGHVWQAGTLQLPASSCMLMRSAASVQKKKSTLRRTLLLRFHTPKKKTDARPVRQRRHSRLLRGGSGRCWWRRCVSWQILCPRALFPLSIMFRGQSACVCKCVICCRRHQHRHRSPRR